MSLLIVEVCEVMAVEPHPNADRLAIATIKGWRSCIRFDPDSRQAEFNPGDKCIFIPPDAVLPAELANAPDDEDIPGRLGVMNYLSKLPRNADGDTPPGGRVKATRLRGIPSYGLIMKIDPEWGDDPEWEIGTNLADHFGITKWEPPPEVAEGDKEPEHPRFHKYTSIENYGNFPDALTEGEEVILTEKIHGKNCRVGLVLDSAEEGEEQWLWMAGSHSVRRKEFDEKGRRSEFWDVLTDNVRDMLEQIRDGRWRELLPNEGGCHSLLLFGEIFGSGVQDMCYGMERNERKFRAFDLAINGQYVDFEAKKTLFEEFEIECVPILHRGPFSRKLIEEWTSGNTTVCQPDSAGRFKGREGIVITPVTERISPLLNSRLILKSISADYLARKGGTDGH